MERIDRPPRIQQELPFGEHKVPKPPEAPNKPMNLLMQLLLPVISTVGFGLASGTQRPEAMIPTGLMMVLSVGFSVSSMLRERRELAAQRKAYQEQLRELRNDMTRSHNAQRMHYLHHYPDAAALLEIAARKETSRFGSRLWERRNSDRDFGAIRLGMGSRPSTVVYKFEDGDGAGNSPLHKDAKKLAADSCVLTDVPVTIPLRTIMGSESNNPLAIGRHSIGIAGKNAAQTADFVRASIAHFAAFHSAQDTRLFIIGHPQQKNQWEWAKWLPHVAPQDDETAPEEDRRYDQLCFSAQSADTQAFWGRIKKELDQRQVRLRDSEGGGAAISLPFMLVVVDMLGDMPDKSPLKEVASEAVVNLINTRGPQLGISIIFAANKVDHIPSECLGLVEVEAVGDRVVFRYAEVGLNSARYLGEADRLSANDARQNFAARIRRLELQRPFGSDLPRAIDLLAMHSIIEGKRVETVDKLPLPANWQYSTVPKNQEWLNAPLGMLSGKEVRNLVFSAKEGGDGVHGMIAGTTGSGKSELIMTLILELALKYDPRVLNFVLVDFKGGQTVEPFRQLPHVVDVLTDKESNAVERMFVAIQAVMEQRASLLAKVNAKDLVDYRKKIAPNLPADSLLPRDFPHLFIIVDEFGEMITRNPDYKSKFESVTRLGRAFGVSLLLATQRPAGFVTDQMRANMKFRICLRVETPDDSKELLGTGEAAYLPNLGGRGYIQVGNDVSTPIQVAWAGKPYTDERKITLKDVIWLDEEKMPSLNASADAPLYSATELAEALRLKPGEVPATVMDWLVGIAAVRAQRDGVPKQNKPWPDPLPTYLCLTRPIDARYLNTERGLRDDKTLVLSPEVESWLETWQDASAATGAGGWRDFNWKAPRPLRTAVGIMDNPYEAEQRVLSVDMADGPLVIFGGPGRGKSTFIKSLLLGLAATRTPRDLNMYVFDFGSDGLKDIRDLPHIGAVIKPSDAARVDQMIRMLRNFVNERTERLANYADLATYNAKNPNAILAEIVFVIDNFIEFKDNFEHVLPDLMTLVRDGRAFGVYFVITASTPTDLNAKFYSLFTQRLTLAQAEPSLYADIVGRGVRNFDNVQGRGVVSMIVKDQPTPLEFQIGMPGVPDDDIEDYKEVAARMLHVWLGMGGKRPAAELPRTVTLLEMFSKLDRREINTISDLEIKQRWHDSLQPKNQEWLKASVGLISSTDVHTLRFQAQADGVHGMAAGTTGSGKSELLQTLIAAMAICYDPRIVNFVLVDYKGGPTVEPFRKLPHCVDIATNLEGNKVDRIFIAINAEMNRRSAILAKAGAADLVEYRKKVAPNLPADSPLPRHFPHLFIIVDEFAEMVTKNPEFKAQFESITRLGRSFGVSLLLATQRPSGVVTDQMRSNMKYRISLRVETPEDSKEMLKRPDAARLPAIAGRGYFQAGSELLTEIQSAWAGAPYAGDAADSPYPPELVLAAIEKPADDPPRSVLGWLVGSMAAEARRQAIPKQFKPWPDPLLDNLPINLPVDASYIEELGGKDGSTVVLSGDLARWASVGARHAVPNADGDAGATGWRRMDWRRPLSLRATIGVMDDPYSSNQHLLTFEVAGDPIGVWGASGRGKTTFVKSLLFALAAQYSPADLNMYCLDFGRGALRAVRELPHCGATIDASQRDRVEALFRMVRGLMNERAERMDKTKEPTLESYNLRVMDNPEHVFPAIVVVIDNFAEFKENYDNLLPDLLTLVRDGRRFGIFFVITATAHNDIPNKLFNLLAQRVAFTMADAGAYVDIVGKGPLPLTDTPGRGFINYRGNRLEFQVAIPNGELKVLSDKSQVKDQDLALSTSDLALGFIGIAERMEEARAKAGFKRPSAEIPKAVTLLEMYGTVLQRRVDRIGDLGIAKLWQDSMKPENQEWLTAPIGLISSKEVRRMIFSAKAGGDGVHGLAAGTTGSGKSELLQTLIASLAIRYDPRIVNFVLVDYKGGPTVEPFRQLPHCVDIATNLEGNKVERIFAAINAEMNRRSSILAKAGVADLVEYRKKVIPSLRPDSPLPKTFPHLFIIVDEFAEMIQNNPEFKTQFESITRLGRSFGVSLLLAAQRPTGVVSDQMRANMKYRMCLRVETTDDSKELLGRPDAALLPAIGGRGYIQVGGGNLNEVQTAWSGAPYDETTPDAVFSTDDILDALNKRDDPPRSLLGWLVGALAAEQKRSGIADQWKPWPGPLPDVLPSNLPIDADYIKAKPQGATQIVINPALAQWVERRGGWQRHDFRTPQRITTALGIVDNPFLAEQRVLNVNMSADPLAVLGAAGRGKSTFAKSLMLSLAAQYSPADLHMYALDLGRGGLRALRKLPHVGGIVAGNEDERVERFFRLIRNIMDERQAKLAAYDSLDDYNAKNPDAPFPAVLVVVDNAIEFKEAQEKYLGELIALVRDSRSFGVSFVVTGSLYNDVPSKLFTVLSQRITLTQADPSDYAMIFNRRTMRINDVPGRGLAVEMIGEDPVPLEFQTAVPLDPHAYERLLTEEQARRGEGEDGTGRIDDKTMAGLLRRASEETQRNLVDTMAQAWAEAVKHTPELEAKRARSVEPLPLALDLAQLLMSHEKLARESAKIKPPNVLLGVNDVDRMPTRIELGAKGPHLLVAGPPVSGKTSTIRALALALAYQYSPAELSMVLIDPSESTRRFYNLGLPDHNLDKLPHVLAAVSSAKEFDAMLMRLYPEYNETWAEALGKYAKANYRPIDNSKRPIVVLIDHYDDIAGMLRGSKFGLVGLAETGKGKNLHIVIGGSLQIMRGSPDELRKRVESSRYSLVMQDFDTIRSMGVKNLKAPSRELPPGRGYLVKAISAAMIQAALPAIDGRDGRSAEDQMAAIVQGLRRRYPNRAQWSYFADDVTPLETLAAGKSLEPAPAAADVPAATQAQASAPAAKPVVTPVAAAAAATAPTAATAAGGPAAGNPAKPQSLAEKMAELKAKQQALLGSMKIEAPTTYNRVKLEVEVPDKPEEKKS
ncbi:MAG: FtsK/SpoIIIE domain-containing protein [Anaerolineae bacterium]|nr:FtsK/SpoIIIE domain-containing protein [Anaerolineae bacterium]